MLWIALHLPALSLESWAATRDAAQAGRPLVLLQDHQVQHADALALARGVRPGMTRSTALALAPDLLQAAADVQRDAQALRAVVHVALAFSPAVCWATPPALRASAEFADAQPAPHAGLVGVRLEVQASLRYFGGLAALLGRLRAALAPLGHRLCIACAPTALGAALLAAWGQGQAGQAGPDRSEDRLTLGPHSSGPDARQALQPLLDGLPLHLLGPGLAHWPVLQGMGLHTLADLRTLPRSGLARRFGPALLGDIDRARGHAPEAHAWLALPLQFASRIELLCRADTSAQVLAGAQLLLARLLAWAGASQSRIARFTLLMHHEPSRRDRDTPSQTALEIAPAEPAADPGHLLGLLTERLAACRWPRPRWSSACCAAIWWPAPHPTPSCLPAAPASAPAWPGWSSGCRPGWARSRCSAWPRCPTTGPSMAPAGRRPTRPGWASKRVPARPTPGRPAAPRPRPAWPSRRPSSAASRCGCCRCPSRWPSGPSNCGWTARPCNCWPAPSAWRPAGGTPTAWRCATTSSPSGRVARWCGSTATAWLMGAVWALPTLLALLAMLAMLALRRSGSCTACSPDNPALLSSAVDHQEAP